MAFFNRNLLQLPPRYAPTDPRTPPTFGGEPQYDDMPPPPQIDPEERPLPPPPGSRPVQLPPPPPPQLPDMPMTRRAEKLASAPPPPHPQEGNLKRFGEVALGVLYGPQRAEELIHPIAARERVQRERELDAAMTAAGVEQKGIQGVYTATRTAAEGARREAELARQASYNREKPTVIPRGGKLRLPSGELIDNTAPQSRAGYVQVDEEIGKELKIVPNEDGEYWAPNSLLSTRLRGNAPSKTAQDRWVALTAERYKLENPGAKDEEARQVALDEWAKNEKAKTGLLNAKSSAATASASGQVGREDRAVRAARVKRVADRVISEAKSPTPEKDAITNLQQFYQGDPDLSDAGFKAEVEAEIRGRVDKKTKGGKGPSGDVEKLRSIIGGGKPGQKPAPQKAAPATGPIAKPPTPGAKLTDESIAKKYLNAAGGNPKEAERLARADNWTL